jgi:hypothetical protein
MSHALRSSVKVKRGLRHALGRKTSCARVPAGDVMGLGPVRVHKSRTSLSYRRYTHQLIVLQLVVAPRAACTTRTLPSVLESINAEALALGVMWSCRPKRRPGCQHLELGASPTWSTLSPCPLLPRSLRGMFVMSSETSQ